MASETDEGRRQAAIKRALALMTEALDLLDGYGASVEAGAHLELAIQKVREAIDWRPT